MLHCPNQTTASYGGNDFSQATSWCECPYCGTGHNCTGRVYITLRSDFVLSEPEPVVAKDSTSRPAWGNPKSDVRPISHRFSRRSGFDRIGRELRHRGGFRNFHKMGD